MRIRNLATVCVAFIGVLSSSVNWRKRMSVNKVILVGRLGKDPETRYTSGGQAVCHFSMATDESYKDRNGERQKRTEWHRITVWGKQAEIAQQYLKKGAQIYLEGSIRTSEWTDKEGQKKTSYEINASTFRMLGSKSDSTGSAYRSASASAGAADFEAEASSQAPAEHEQSGPEVTDEDIPF
jgi:single-strand DNA-binding protein